MTLQQPYRPEMIATLKQAYELGVRFFDTAEAYGPWENEKILGEALSAVRNDIKIATKFGWNIDEKTGQRLDGLNSRPSHIKVAVEAMLKRLKTDRIDLLYQHRVDPAVPIEDVAEAVDRLMQEGKVLNWGLSEMGLKTLRRAHKVLPLAAVQCEYSLLLRGVEDNGVLDACDELGIGFVPWSPLGVQFLTGYIDEKTSFAPGDFRSLESRFSRENLKQNMALVDILKRYGELKNTSPASIALAWLLAKRPYIVPIPGSTNITTYSSKHKCA